MHKQYKINAIGIFLCRNKKQQQLTEKKGKWNENQKYFLIIFFFAWNWGCVSWDLSFFNKIWNWKICLMCFSGELYVWIGFFLELLKAFMWRMTLDLFLENLSGWLKWYEVVFQEIFASKWCIVNSMYWTKFFLWFGAMKSLCHAQCA